MPMMRRMMDQMGGFDEMPQIPQKYNPPSQQPQYGQPAYGRPVSSTPPMGGGYMGMENLISSHGSRPGFVDRIGDFTNSMWDPSKLQGILGPAPVGNMDFKNDPAWQEFNRRDRSQEDHLMPMPPMAQGQPVQRTPPMGGGYAGGGRFDVGIGMPSDEEIARARAAGTGKFGVQPTKPSPGTWPSAEEQRIAQWKQIGQPDPGNGQWANLPNQGPRPGMGQPGMPQRNQMQGRTNPYGGQQRQMQQMMQNPQFMRLLMRMFQGGGMR